MVRVTIQRNGVQIDCKYAAPSISTGRFVACIEHNQGYSPDQLQDIFANPGELVVHNIESMYADKVYTCYKTVDEIRVGQTEDIIVLGKGELTGA